MRFVDNNSMKVLVLSAILLLFACGSPSSSEVVPSKKPNIIYILADDLGYGDLGCYGQQDILTPHLDRMADQGIRFTQHYAGSTVCAPSRCTLMTGYHTGHARIRGNATLPLGVEDTTVATCLKKAGYMTALIGKWGLGEAGSTGIPNRQGFDFFYGYLNQIKAHNYYPEFLWRNQEKEMLPNEVVYAQDGYARGVGTAATKKEVYSHDRFTEEALDFIDKHRDTSFFLYLAYTIPHTNNEHRLVSEHGQEVPDLGDYANRDWPEVQKATAAMITRMDRDIGRLFDQLEDLDIDNNTIVLFSSDNGPHHEGGNDPEFFDSNGPFTGTKRDLTDGGIRVPFLARWPGKIPAGMVDDTPSAFWDFLPTACEIAGVNPPSGLDGVSLLPVLLGESKLDHPPLYWEFYEQGGKQAILMDPWKAIRSNVHAAPNGPVKLFNLDQDPTESMDLNTENPKIVSSLERLMQYMHQPSETFVFDWEQ